MPTVPVSGRADLTDAQWAVLEPLLPVGKEPGRPPTWAKRQLIDGIRWRARAGVPWRDVPERYGAVGVGVRVIQVLAARWRLGAECGINRLKRHRAVATCYDKLAVRYEAIIHIAAIGEWLRPDFLNTP